MLSVTTYAYDFIENGIAYNLLKDGTLSVTNKQPDGWWKGNFKDDLAYKGDIKIPSEVTHKGKKYKVTEIDYYAFHLCQNLNSVSLPEGLKIIREKAFDINHESLKSIHIPASVEMLEPGCFFRLHGLSEITVSPKNKHYKSEGNCIYNKDMTQLILVCPKSRAYKFPPTVTSAVDYAFSGTSINKLIIPSTLTHIGGNTIDPMTIKTIICKKNLKKLPGSKQYVNGTDLPEWATGH